MDFKLTLPARLRLSEKYSDMSLRCGNTVFRVHRAIVCTRSAVLDAAIDGNFKDSTFPEVDLSEHELSVVQAMVQYLYSEDYEDNSHKMRVKKKHSKLSATSFGDQQSPLELESPIIFNIKVYLIADQYKTPTLKTLADFKYSSAVTEMWDPFLFTEALGLLWRNTVEGDRPMRKTVATIAARRIHFLFRSEEFVALIEAKGDVAVEVLKAVLEEGTANLMTLPATAAKAKK
ncbi:hypothetical protein LARI1_G001835 [Lachnellula arida]|uniref:BTB domain-containing protein n=1 Tax=Lachnellula arida TaxID=1316785 RepID=A0A8T9BK55_9HELO|nr:hypothetical protein LARI1_G001835 [Lachnellula arida]